MIVEAYYKNTKGDIFHGIVETLNPKGALDIRWNFIKIFKNELNWKEPIALSSSMIIHDSELQIEYPEYFI